MKSFLKIFKSKDKTKSDGEELFETWDGGPQGKIVHPWSQELAAVYLNILEISIRKFGSSKLSESCNDIKVETLIKEFRDRHLDDKFFERFEANDLFHAAVQILESRDPILPAVNSQAILFAARSVGGKAGKNESIISNLSSPALQVLGGLCSFCEIVGRHDSASAAILSRQLAPKLLPSLASHPDEIKDAFPYLMGNSYELFPFVQQFKERVLGSNAKIERISEREWAQFFNEGSHGSDYSSTPPPESPSLRDSVVKVTLNKVDSSLDFPQNNARLTIPDSKNEYGIAGTSAKSQPLEEAESKGAEYQDRTDDKLPQIEDIEYFDNQSEISEVDTKIALKPTATNAVTNNLKENKNNDYETNDFDDESIEDIGLVETKSDNAHFATNLKSKPNVIDQHNDSILDIPELDSSEHKDKDRDSENSWDREDEEEDVQAVQSKPTAPSVLLSPAVFSNTANRWKTENAFTFDESDSDEASAVGSKNKSFSDDASPHVPTSSSGMKMGTIEEGIAATKDLTSKQGLFVLTNLDLSRDSENAIESPLAVNRNLSTDETQQEKLRLNRDHSWEASKTLKEQQERQRFTRDSSWEAPRPQKEQPLTQQSIWDIPNESSKSQRNEIREEAKQVVNRVRFEETNDSREKGNEKAVLDTINTNLPTVVVGDKRELPHNISHVARVPGEEKADTPFKSTASKQTEPKNQPFANENGGIAISNSQKEETNVVENDRVSVSDDAETSSMASDSSQRKEKAKKKGFMGFMSKIKSSFSLSKKSRKKDSSDLKDEPEASNNNEMRDSANSMSSGIAMNESEQKENEKNSKTESALLQEVKADNTSKMPFKGSDVEGSTPQILQSIGQLQFQSHSQLQQPAQSQPQPEQLQQQQQQFQQQKQQFQPQSQPQQAPVREFETSVEQKPQTKEKDLPKITTLVHDETEKSILELFEHIQRRDSSSSVSSVESNINSKTLGTNSKANEDAEPPQGKPGDRLSNPALRSKPGLSRITSVFRRSTSKQSAAQEQPTSSSPLPSPLPVVATSDSSFVVPSQSTQFETTKNATIAPPAEQEISGEASLLDSENHSIASSAASVGLQTKRFGVNRPRNGTGLAKLLRNSKKTEDEGGSVDLLIAPNEVDLLQRALIRSRALSEQLTALQAKREDLRLQLSVLTLSPSDRIEVIRADILRIQSNRVKKFVSPSLGEEEVVNGGHFSMNDQESIRKRFEVLRNGSSVEICRKAAADVKAGKEYIASLLDVTNGKGAHPALDKKASNDNQILATVVKEPLFGVLSMDLPLPKHISDAPYSPLQMSAMAEAYAQDQTDNGYPFRVNSEWDSATGIHFSGDLLMRLPRGGFKKRYFILILNPIANPNLNLKVFAPNAPFAKIDEIKETFYRRKISREYYLMEYSSRTLSRWGNIPIGFKRCYPISQLMSIQTKTEVNKKSLDFNLIFQAKSTTDETEKAQLQSYMNVLQTNMEVEKVEKLKALKRQEDEKKRLPPAPEVVQLQSYMNILQKNTLHKPSVENQSPDEEEGKNRKETGDPIPPSSLIGEAAAEDKSGDSFNEELQQEFSDIDEVGGGKDASEYDDENLEEYFEEETAAGAADREAGDVNVQSAALQAQREIHKILSDPLHRKGNKDIISLVLRAAFPDERMKWVAAIRSSAKKEVYLNTINY